MIEWTANPLFGVGLNYSCRFRSSWMEINNDMDPVEQAPLGHADSETGPVTEDPRQETLRI